MSARAAQRIKEIVDALMTTRVADLSDRAQTQRRIQELQTSIGEVQTFARSIESLLGHFGSAPAAPRRPGRPPKSASVMMPRPVAVTPMHAVRRGGRGPGNFSATPFILEAVRGAGSGGIRPREIVEQVVAAAPGQHVRPSALVSTILTRLKRRGEVRRRSGKWYGVAA